MQRLTLENAATLPDNRTFTASGLQPGAMAAYILAPGRLQRDCSSNFLLGDNGIAAVGICIGAVSLSVTLTIEAEMSDVINLIEEIPVDYFLCINFVMHLRLDAGGIVALAMACPRVKGMHLISPRFTQVREMPVNTTLEWLKADYVHDNGDGIKTLGNAIIAAKNLRRLDFMNLELSKPTIWKTHLAGMLDGKKHVARFAHWGQKNLDVLATSMAMVRNGVVSYENWRPETYDEETCHAIAAHLLAWGTQRPPCTSTLDMRECGPLTVVSEVLADDIVKLLAEDMPLNVRLPSLRSIEGIIKICNAMVTAKTSGWTELPLTCYFDTKCFYTDFLMEQSFVPMAFWKDAATIRRTQPCYEEWTLQIGQFMRIGRSLVVYHDDDARLMARFAYGRGMFSSGKCNRRGVFYECTLAEIGRFIAKNGLLHADIYGLNLQGCFPTDGPFATLKTLRLMDCNITLE